MTDSNRDNCFVVFRALGALERGETSEAREILRTEYPFQGQPSAKRAYTKVQSLRVFLDDGFVDRYTGKRLVNPGALRVLSLTLPEEFPAHSNWKLSETHIGFYELFPTVDHVVPVTRGGTDEPKNWVPASMFSNSAKGNALLEEIGWSLRPPGELSAWDGMSEWLLSYTDGHGELMSDRYLLSWQRATRQALEGRCREGSAANREVTLS